MSSLKPHPTRKILHLDMDAFFASVEQRDFPELRGQPVVVGGNRNNRGVVAAASYEARRYGIHSAMSMGEAFRRCPQLKRQTHRMDVYIAESRKIRDIFFQYTDKVQPLSVDEAFLDVTETSWERGMTATRLAFELKGDIFAETGLTASAGVAPNKFLAKIASDLNKPNGLTVVQPHEVQAFLDPLPVKKIWGIGPATAKRLHLLGIRQVGQLRAMSLSELSKEFGKLGLHYHQLSRGVDNRPVEWGGQAKSLSTERTFSQDIRDPLELQRHIEKQARELSARLHNSGLLGQTVVLKLRYAGFDTVTRSSTTELAHRDEQRLVRAALELLERTDYRERPVRLLGLGMTGLMDEEGPVQLHLFDDE